LNGLIQYTLPTPVDPEGQTVYTTFSPELNFLILRNNILIMNPTSLESLGLYTLTVTLSDGMDTSSYAFNITVTNSGPRFILRAP